MLNPLSGFFNLILAKDIVEPRMRSRQPALTGPDCVAKRIRRVILMTRERSLLWEDFVRLDVPARAQQDEPRKAGRHSA